MAFYEFSQNEVKRYTKECARVLGDLSIPQFTSEVYHRTGEHISAQTLRNWWDAPGAIPSTVVILLVDNFGANLVDLCPWLKNHVK